MSQFLTPLINRRRDGYGGSTEGRARFPLEVVRAIREECPHTPLLVKMNGDDGIAYGGLHLDEALTIARWLVVDGGADAIVPSFGYTSLNGFGMLRGEVPLGEMAEAMPDGSKTLTRLLGRCLVPQIAYEPLFLQEQARPHRRELLRRVLMCMAPRYQMCTSYRDRAEIPNVHILPRSRRDAKCARLDEIAPRCQMCTS